MATTLLMAHYWVLHKYCQAQPPAVAPPTQTRFIPFCFFLFYSLPLLPSPLSLLLPNNDAEVAAVAAVAVGRLKPFLQVQRRPNSPPHDSPPDPPQYPRTLRLDLKRRQEKNQVTRATRSGQVGGGAGDGGVWPGKQEDVIPLDC